MDTKDTRTRRLVRWLRDKIEKRQDGKDDHDPWWVTLMLDVGRPAVAIMILTMCAPGEHYLMLEARFVDPFAWLGPGTLTAYAGIAAVTATKRPKGSPGHGTAVTGAVLSIALAMAAQPISHLWGQKNLDLQHILLICVVSSVPSAVFGHLLHMGAAPTGKARRDKNRTVRPDKARTPRRTAADTVAPPVPDVQPDMVTWTGQPDTDKDNRTPDTPDVKTDTPTRVQSIRSGSLSADVREFLSTHPDATDDQLSLAIKLGRPDAQWDSIRKARDRYWDKNGRTA